MSQEGASRHSLIKKIEKGSCEKASFILLSSSFQQHQTFIAISFFKHPLASSTINNTIMNTSTKQPRFSMEKTQRFIEKSHDQNQKEKQNQNKHEKCHGNEFW